MRLEDKQFLFIIGSPRSGTTMLQVLLGSHPQVATTQELTLFNQYVTPWLEHWKAEHKSITEKGWLRGLPILWSEEEIEQFLKHFLETAYTKVGEHSPERTHFLDKNPGYSVHVGAIRRLLPKARFIHIIRDGRDVAASLVAASEKMGFCTPDPGTAGIVWDRCVRGALAARAFGEDYLELRYEDFLDDQTELYGRVLKFCGLSADQDWITKTIAENTFEKMKSRRATGNSSFRSSEEHYRRGKAGGWRGDFGPPEWYAFDRAAGDLLRELGYAESGWWANTVTDRWLVPAKAEARRRARVVGLGLTLLRRGLLGHAMPAGLEFFER